MLETKAAIIVVLITATCSLARAESTAQALEAFGLVGTWSADCANESLARITYAVSVLSSPTVTAITLEFKQVFEIDSAVRITEDKLRTTKHYSSYVLNGKPLAARTQDKYVSVLLKSGSKYRSLDSYVSDGKYTTTLVKNGSKYAPNPQNIRDEWHDTRGQSEILEKCLN